MKINYPISVEGFALVDGTGTNVAMVNPMLPDQVQQGELAKRIALLINRQVEMLSVIRLYMENEVAPIGTDSRAKALLEEFEIEPNGPMVGLTDDERRFLRQNGE